MEAILLLMEGISPNVSQRWDIGRDGLLENIHFDEKRFFGTKRVLQFFQDSRPNLFNFATN